MGGPNSARSMARSLSRCPPHAAGRSSAALGMNTRLPDHRSPWRRRGCRRHRSLPCGRGRRRRGTGEGRPRARVRRRRPRSSTASMRGRPRNTPGQVGSSRVERRGRGSSAGRASRRRTNRRGRAVCGGACIVDRRGDPAELLRGGRGRRRGRQPSHRQVTVTDLGDRGRPHRRMPPEPPQPRRLPARIADRRVRKVLAEGRHRHTNKGKQTHLLPPSRGHANRSRGHAKTRSRGHHKPGREVTKPGREVTTATDLGRAERGNQSRTSHDLSTRLI